jgi:WD40 repeat protein
VTATTRFGSPCVIYANTNTVVVPAAGATVEIDLTLVPSGSCGGGDTGGTGGTGGGSLPPSLSHCTEYHHSDVTCDLTAGVGDPIVYSIAFSPDGTLVITGGDDGQAKVWRFDGRTLVAEGHVLRGTGYGVVAFSPDGTTVAVGWTGGIDLYSTSTWLRLRTLTTTAGNRIYDLAFTPDGVYVISIDIGNLYAHAVATTTALHTVAIADSTWALAVSPAASAAPGVAVATQSGTVRLFTHAATGFVLSTSAPLEVDLVGAIARSVRFSPDGRLLAAGGGDGLLHLWNYPITSTAPTVPDIDVGTPVLTDDLNMAAFSPDGRYLAIAGAFNPSLTTWNSAAPRSLINTKADPTYDLISVAFSPDGAALIAGEVDCGLVLVCAD